MRFASTIMFFVAFVSCTTNTNEWQTIDFKAFKIKTPSGWRKFIDQGVDSYVGGLTNGKDSLWFDYGWYDVDLTGQGTYAQRYANDTVNGLSARIMIPDTAGKGYISMHIPKVSEKDKFTIWGVNIKGTNTILKIYKSVIFKNSDTLKNPELTASKFIFKANGSGKILFYDNCAMCHSIYKEGAGPALNALVNKRTNEWIYNFLTDRNKVQDDTAYHSLGNKNELHCLKFPNLSKEDIDLLCDYLRNQ